MKMKTRFLLGVLLLFSITMQGQQVKVNYENITNSLPIYFTRIFPDARCTTSESDYQG